MLAPRRGMFGLGEVLLDESCISNLNASQIDKNSTHSLARYGFIISKLYFIKYSHFLQKLH